MVFPTILQNNNLIFYNHLVARASPICAGTDGSDNGLYRTRNHDSLDGSSAHRNFLQPKAGTRVSPFAYEPQGNSGAANNRGSRRGNIAQESNLLKNFIVRYGADDVTAPESHNSVYRVLLVSSRPIETMCLMQPTTRRFIRALILCRSWLVFRLAELLRNFKPKRELFFRGNYFLRACIHGNHPNQSCDI